jgi:hypothetical protein
MEEMFYTIVALFIIGLFIAPHVQTILASIPGGFLKKKNFENPNITANKPMNIIEYLSLPKRERKRIKKKLNL